jgi:hypothetical protein
MDPQACQVHRKLCRRLLANYLGNGLPERPGRAFERDTGAVNGVQHLNQTGIGPSAGSDDKPIPHPLS